MTDCIAFFDVPLGNQEPSPVYFFKFCPGDSQDQNAHLGLIGSLNLACLANVLSLLREQHVMSSFNPVDFFVKAEIEKPDTSLTTYMNFEKVDVLKPYRLTAPARKAAAKCFLSKFREDPSDRLFMITREPMSTAYVCSVFNVQTKNFEELFTPRSLTERTGLGSDHPFENPELLWLASTYSFKAGNMLSGDLSTVNVSPYSCDPEELLSRLKWTEGGAADMDEETGNALFAEAWSQNGGEPTQLASEPLNKIVKDLKSRSFGSAAAKAAFTCELFTELLQRRADAFLQKCVPDDYTDPQNMADETEIRVSPGVLAGLRAGIRPDKLGDFLDLAETDSEIRLFGTVMKHSGISCEDRLAEFAEQDQHKSRKL